MTLYKYCANGNDFLLFHTLFTQGDYSELARKVCDRHSGIGADGLVALLPFSDDEIAYQWDFYNADGSRANMCGNASRCAAHYAYNLGLAPREHSFITHSSMQAQVIKVRVKGDIVSSNLGVYRNLFALESLPSDAVQKVDSSVPREVAATLLNAAKWHYIDTGVPHLVCFVDDVSLATKPSAAVKAFMQELRKSFNANVNLAYAKHSDEIYLATYERGVEDITLACGTGMAATLLVGHKVWGLESGASLVPPSGDRLKLWCEPIGDSACGLESRISARVRRLHTPSMRPCVSLKNHDSSSTILESQSSGESHKSHREQVEPERSPTSNTANPRILEKRKQAGREKSAQSLESTFEKNEQATQKVDSRENAPILNESAKDSSKSPSDSKILDEKCGLQGKSQGSYLDGNDRRDFSPLPHFSLKAESPQVDSTSKLPTLAHINELESKAYSGDMEVFLEGQVRCVAVCQTCYD